MKRILAGLMTVGLVLTNGAVHAQPRQGDSFQHRETAPNQTPATQNPVVVPQPGGEVQQTVPPAPPSRSGVLQKPSGVLNKPSGELNKPSGVLRKPSGVLDKPSGVLNKSPGVITTLPAKTQVPPKQNFVGGQREIRHFPHNDGNWHNRNFHRGTFHGRRSSLVVVYVNGAPFWYPVYTSYPYYYATPAPDYSGGYPADTGYVPLAESETASYVEVGRLWGQDLRREIVTWEQFIDYVRDYIINANPAAQADFREAFIASYGLNGAAAYDKAADQAAGPASPGPKVINMQSAY